MTKQDQFLEYIKNFKQKSLDTVVVKNQDYAGKDEPMRNFIDSAMIAGVTVEQGILVRAADKIARFRNLTEKDSGDGAVGEKLSDTLQDLANYAAILAYYSDSKKEDFNQLMLDLAETSEDTPEPEPESEQTINKFKSFFGL